jgi:hypothetical protein
MAFRIGGWRFFLPGWPAIWVPALCALGSAKMLYGQLQSDSQQLTAHFRFLFPESHHGQRRHALLDAPKVKA